MAATNSLLVEHPNEDIVVFRINRPQVRNALNLEVRTRLESIEGRKLTFSVRAHDGVDTICEGHHQRHLIDVSRFNTKIASKIATAGALA